MSLPPSYEQATRELQQLKASGLSSAQLTSAYQAMSAKVAEPARMQELLDGIQDLATRAVTMDHAFEAIRVELGKVDGFGYTDKDGKPIEKFQPVWTGYQRRYIDLLWGSRRAATSTEGYVQEFVEVIIPLVKDTTVPLADRKSELLAFIQRTNPNASKSSQTGTTSTQFTNLLKDVQAFITKYLQFATERGTEVSDEIKNLNKAISDLDARIAAADKIIITLLQGHTPPS